MTHQVTIHHLDATDDEPECLKITVDDQEVWSAYATEMREMGDWPQVVRGVATAVAAVVRQFEALDAADG